jgi:hypothetical protein
MPIKRINQADTIKKCKKCKKGTRKKCVKNMEKLRKQ